MYARTYNKKYYVPATELKVVTYILKNTANGEYFYGVDGSEEAGNSYNVCNDSKAKATRIALKVVGENTVNLLPAYNDYYFDWRNNITMSEDYYVQNYANAFHFTDNKVIGGTTSATGVLKDVYRFSATTNDLFVIAPTAAPTYKKLAVGDKIVISRAANTDEVVYEKG